MASKMYAWSDIEYDADVDPDSGARKPKYIRRGEEVNRSKLGVDEENFQALVDAGSVRPMKFPDIPATFQGSPVEWYREELAKTQEGVEADVAMSMGGSYFGPNAEELMAEQLEEEPSKEEK